MANELRIKRRVSGNAGAPAALKSAELAWNMVDDTLYGGKGDDGNGNATSVVPLGGLGHFAPLASPALTGAPTVPTAAPGTNTTQIASTAFVQAAVTSGSVTALADVGDVTITSIANGEILKWNGSAWINNTLAEAGIAAANHSHPISEVTGLQTALDAKAPLASPTFTGTPAAPTPTGGDNTTKIATTAFVQAAVSALIDAAPGTLDTLNEIAAALGDDPNFATTITASIATKLTAASNLSDVVDPALARTNIGLGTMAVQAASSVAITGGTINGVTLDGGTF